MSQTRIEELEAEIEELRSMIDVDYLILIRKLVKEHTINPYEIYEPNLKDGSPYYIYDKR